jgi:hypothetical protein
MKLKSEFLMVLISLSTAFALTACSGEGQEKTPKKETAEHDSHAGMDHSGSGELPDGLKKAEDPTYEVGSKAVINADHMPGMDGAEATISGAFTTTVYALSYDPTNGGERVENHKWVIHEELEDAGEQPLKKGDEATIDTEHMPGMNGANATIDTAEETTVYMVDFTPTDGGEKVTNHKWVTEDELSPVK